MATTPSVHELSNCTVYIRPDPQSSFTPGSTVSGHIALVSVNQEGVRDVKHRLDIGSLSLKYFWEARATDAAEPTYLRGGTTFVSLVGGDGEQVLLMPAAGPSGANTFEAAWEFSFTLPEKGAVDFQTANLAPPTTGTGKSRAAPLPSLPSGPPPSFSSNTRKVQHILEAHLAFAGAGPEASADKVDVQGYRVAGGDLDVVERTIINVRPDAQRLEVPESLLKGWETTLPASGLRIQVKPKYLPISAALMEPLVLDAFLQLPPAPASPNAGGEKKKSSLLSTLTGGKGKEKRREEEAAHAQQQQQQQQHGGVSFVVERFGGHIEIVTTGAATVKIPITDEDVNIASQHPVLSQGLSTELHLDFAHPLEPELAQYGTIAVPGLVERRFLLSLWVKTSLVPEPQALVQQVEIPVFGAVFSPATGTDVSAGGDGAATPASGGWDYGAPPDGPPPPMDEPPTWGAAMGEGASIPSRTPGIEDGPPPPGYM